MREVSREIPVVRDTLIDKLVGVVSPEKALRRRHARTMLAITGAYDGARKDKRGLRMFNPQGGSADADINYDLPTLRERSRDLARNNPIGGGAIHTVVNNVVGTGLRLNAQVNRKVLGMTPEEANDFEETVEYCMGVWSAECDLERNLTFSDLQELAFRSTLENGDAVGILPFKRRPGEAFGTKIQLIEADRLSNPNSRADSETMSAGVELDGDGAPVRYHIQSCHPGDMKAGLKRDWKAYDAFTPDGRRSVIHLYDKMRIGQHRGIPYLSPIIEIVKQLGRYTDAEVMAAVVSGMFTGFVHTENREGIDTTDLLATDSQNSSKTTGDNDVKLGYGTIIDLDLNEKIDFANPGRPNQAFDGFVLAVSRQIGQALQLPYEVLVKHFTASYTAARAAMLDAWVFYLKKRAWLVRCFCTPVYEAFMWELVARGLVYAPGFTTDPFIRAAYLGAEWIGPTQPQIDPVKEVDAAEKRVGLNISTRAEECLGIMGNEWEPKVEQMKREKELLGELVEPPIPALSSEGGKGKEKNGSDDKNGSDEEK